VAAPFRDRLPDGAPCLLGVRPEDVGVSTGGGVSATVVTTEPLGGETVVDLQLGDRIVKALVDPTLDLADGQAVSVALDPRRLHLFDDAGDALLSAAGDDILGVRAR
jgi:multiple sugar transport system ATP-binding protein